MAKKTKVDKTKSKVKKSNVEVTLLQNGYVHGEFHYAGETVEVTPEIRDYLLKTSPEVYK